MNCDRIAPWYRYLEYASFGPALQQRRCYFLPKLKTARSVLMLGEGDGRFLARFVAQNQDAEIDYVDASAKMLRLAALRVTGYSRVRLHCLDLMREDPPGKNYDLVVTHFFLDCFTDNELAAVLEKVRAATAPSAEWIVSEFREPADGWQRWRARAWVSGLYFGFRIMTGLKTRGLPDYAGALSRMGFELQSEAIASRGLLTSQMWQRRGRRLQ